MNFYIDIETRSELDVTKVGAFAYAEHPSTELLCMAYAAAEGPVMLWTPGEAWPVPAGACPVIVAHNIDFEREVIGAKVGPVYDSFEWLDTAALAARMSLPRNLEELGAFFGHEKDMEGQRIMKKLCAPRRASKDNLDKWWTPASKPEDFQKLYDYCRQDVVVMRAIHRKLLPLDEPEVFHLTERMNARGVKLDLASIPAARRDIDAASTALLGRFRELLNITSRSPVKVAARLRLPDLRKPTVRKALREPNRPVEELEALRIHQTLARSSTAKLEAMLRRVSRDGRLRGAMVYAGAERTARWSSMGVQLQNFPRGLGTATEEAFQALKAGVLPVVYADPVGTVAEMLRGFLVGPFLVGDFAQIEARMLAWLAGEEPLLQLFREKADPYCAMASRIYSKPVTKKDKDERFMGKQVVLGAGYGLGHRGFRRLLDETYDVDVSEEFAQRVVKVYRAANPAIVKFWGLLERGWAFATQKDTPGKKYKVGPVYMGTVHHQGEKYTFIELPSGRRMYYARPEVKSDELRYFGRDLKRGGMWGTVKTYGGKLAENVTQAASRDVLAEAMLRLDDLGFNLVATVHDEVVCETHPLYADAELKQFEEELVKVPRWAKGLPIEAEVFQAQRYRK